MARLVFVLGLLFVPALPAERAVALEREEEAAVRRASAAYVEAMQANDWRRVAASFTEDAVRMPPHEPAHQGRSAIERWLSQGVTVTKYALTIDEIRGDSGLAYVRASYAIAFVPPRMTNPIEEMGKALEIWVREQDGEWRMDAAIWNTNLPPPLDAP